MKRGILGGTFNPVHLGHIRLALEVMEKAGLDEILFIPSGTPPHKPSGELAPAADRYEMVRLAKIRSQSDQSAGHGAGKIVVKP